VKPVASASGRFPHLVVLGIGTLNASVVTLNASVVTLTNGELAPARVSAYMPITAKTRLVPETLTDSETEKLLEVGVGDDEVARRPARRSAAGVGQVLDRLHKVDQVAHPGEIRPSVGGELAVGVRVAGVGEATAQRAHHDLPPSEPLVTPTSGS
jgi:hypothetical protein